MKNTVSKEWNDCDRACVIFLVAGLVMGAMGSALCIILFLFAFVFLLVSKFSK
jgi:maltodextrin utilization protein YvdJ